MIHQQQSNCTLPVANYHLDNTFGIGSHLHIWSQAVCHAITQGYRLRSYNPIWLWRDQMLCDTTSNEQSALLCYLPKSEFLCGHSEIVSPTTAHNITDPRNKKQSPCPLLQEHNQNNNNNNNNNSNSIIHPTLREFRAGSVEYLFRTGVSTVVINEARRQIGLIFPNATIPPDLICVHIRWGDKFWEMKLATISEYITSVQTILRHRGHPDPNRTAAHIYIATEDPTAVQAMRDSAPPAWNLYSDSASEIGAARPRGGNMAKWAAYHTRGRAGLMAFASLLVAMEATAFVLTTESNWSRLLDYLRTNIVDAGCSHENDNNNNNNNGGTRRCTEMIDLRPGMW